MLLPCHQPSSSYSLLKFVYVISQLRHSLVRHPSQEKSWIRPSVALVHFVIDRAFSPVVTCSILGTLRNYDGNGNGNVNVENSAGLLEQNNNSARASRFFVHFSAVRAQLQRELTKFLVDLRTGTARRWILISLWTPTRSPLFSSNLTSFISNNWMTWYKGEKVSKDATSIFQQRFHWRRRSRIVRSLFCKE